MAINTLYPPFDPDLFVRDNRILPDQIAFQDAMNPTIWIHPDDLTPARESQLREKLENAFSLPYPPYKDDPVRGMYMNALQDKVAVPPNLSNAIPDVSAFHPLPSDPYDYPLSHMVNGEPFPELLSAAGFEAYREATKIYLMVECVLADKGYPELLGTTADSLQQRGVAHPSLQQLLHDLRDALGTTTTQMVETVATDGADSVAQLIGIDPDLQGDIYALVDHMSTRGFPLNDVINWTYGRVHEAQTGQSPAPVAEAIAMGKEVRIDSTVTDYRNRVDDYVNMPEQRRNEELVAGAMDYVPPVVSELFFEEGGVIIMTQEPDLYTLTGTAATGYHTSFESVSPNGETHSMYQIYLSQDLGTPRNNRTLVHELHHLMYPSQFMSMEDGQRGDALLASDEARLIELKALADEYVTGTAEQKAHVMAMFDSPRYASGGQSVSEMLRSEDTSVQTFIGAINEAFQFLQMESPTYDRIQSYEEPLDRFREVIPRYAEMRYVEHVDHKGMMDFIVPGITEIYQDIYLPHLQRRLEHIQETRPSKVAATWEDMATTVPMPDVIPDTLPPELTQQVEGSAIRLWPQESAAYQQAAPLNPHSMIDTVGISNDGLVTMPQQALMTAR